MPNTTSRRLKVLFLTSWFPTTEEPVNGIFVKEHALASQIYDDVTVVATSVVPTLRNPVATREVYDGLSIIRFQQGLGQPPKLRYLARLRNEVRFVKKLIEEIQPELIHATTFQSAVTAAIACRKGKIPFVVTEHWSGFYLGMVRGLELRKARYGLNRANRVLPVSQFLAEKIAEHGIRTRIEVVPNVIDSELFRPAETLPINDPPLAIAIGVFKPVKGMIYLVEAIGRLAEAGVRLKVLIVGDGPEKEKCEMRIRELDIRNMVEMPGFLPKPAIPELLRSADFFISPSLGETFAVALVEALACGIPVVATNVGAVPEVVNDERGILVKPQDPQALAEGIRRMIAERGRFDSLKISNFARERFNRPRIAEQLDRIYREVIG